MITLTFIAILLCCMGVAVMNWRHGWIAAVVCGVLQDPVRKMTPGTPAVLSMSIVAVYVIVLIASITSLQKNRADFAKRFPNVYGTVVVFLIALCFAALNGLITFGVALWKVPALSLLIYCIPIPAVLLGYAWLQREEQIVGFFIFYAVITSIAMIGTPLEFFQVSSPALGMVALPEGFIRHLPGLQIRILSGFYRAPDIMGWHAATLTAVGMVMAIRSKIFYRAWPWVVVAAWGFFNCILSGRRKAVYMAAVFALAFLWRYYKRLNTAQVALVVVLGAALTMVVHEIGSTEESQVYAKGAVTTTDEVLGRLEGGFFDTLRTNSIVGLGLGAATQGVRHVSGLDHDYGWQEGGLGKLAVELGLPGLFVVGLLAWTVFRTMVKITAVGDIPGTSQLIRIALFALVVANVGNFLASAQAYSDPVLTLMTAFFVGALFATAALDERLVESTAGATATVPVPQTA